MKAKNSNFTSISLEDYIEMNLQNNPSKNKEELYHDLSMMLKAYKNGERCNCGNDIWVIGSASLGRKCFTCITGEEYPSKEYFEIKDALHKRENTVGKRNISDIKPTEIHGFFDDEGYEIDTNLIKKPSLCILCVNDDNPKEKPLCDMTRYDQKDEDEFVCYAFKKRIQ